MAPRPPGAYRAAGATAHAEIRDQGSVFLAIVQPITSAEEAKTGLAAIVARPADLAMLERDQ